MTRVLFVDDEPLLLRGLKAMVRRDQRIVGVFADGVSSALAAWESAPFDVVVTDMRMPGLSGLDLLETLLARAATAKRILLTGYADAAMLEKAQRLCDHVLSKPCPWSEIVAAIDPQPIPSVDSNASNPSNARENER